MRPRNLIRIATWIFPLVVCSIWLLASVSAASDDDDVPQFGPWSAPVNLGCIVNSTKSDLDAFISKDGLTLYFASGRPGGFGDFDIYVSQRASVDEPWGPPQNLGPSVNTPFTEFAPTLSPDGHRLFFARSRSNFRDPDFDLYVSRRHNKRDDFGWQPAENLGSGVNTPARENGPAYFEDDVTGTITLYFDSNRLSNFDIYASTLDEGAEGETFGPAVLVQELSTPFNDLRPAIRRDGREMFFISDRPGSIIGPSSLPSNDIWVSTRASTLDPWGTPENLGPVVNSNVVEGRPALSFDATALYFTSTRPGGCGPGPGDLQDLWVSTRTKLPEPGEDNE